MTFLLMDDEMKLRDGEEEAGLSPIQPNLLWHLGHTNVPKLLLPLTSYVVRKLGLLHLFIRQTTTGDEVHVCIPM